MKLMNVSKLTSALSLLAASALMFFATPSAHASYLPDGSYCIQNAGSELYIDVWYASPNAGAAIDAWYGNGGTNQKWELSNVGANQQGMNEVTFQSRESWLYMDVWYASQNQYASIDQWYGNGGDNQKWYLEQVSGSNAYFIVSVNSGQMLWDQANYPGGTLYQAYGNGNNSHDMWYLYDGC